MRTIRRVGGWAIAGLVLTGVVGGPAASAAETQTKSPETYVGSAAGKALHIKIGAQEATAGLASVNLDSSLKAVAESAGSLGLPIVGGDNATKAQVAGDGTRDQKAEACATPAFPAPISTVIDLGAACSTSLAEVKGGMPHALGNGKVFKLDVSANTVLDQLSALPISQIEGVVNTVFGGIDTINDTLNQGSGGNIPDLQLNDTVGELLTALQTTKTLSAVLGDSSAEVTTDGNKVVSTSVSRGGVIQLLPLGASVTLPDGTVQLKPVVEIEVGSSKAQAIYDRATGVSTPSFDPAIVTIRVNTPTTDVISGITQELAGISLQEFKLVPGQPTPPGLPVAVVTKCADAQNEYCVLPGTPLETRIAVASGRTVANADGSVGAIADAVKIHALRNIAGGTPLDGGILLELAHTEAGVGGKPAQLVTINAPDLPRELPRTGGTPWLPIAGVLGVALAVIGRRGLAKVVAR
jgi:hypothetical protein